MATNQNIIRCEQDGVEFFVVDATGETGMSVSGLARLCGVKQARVTELLKRAVIAKSDKKSLQPLYSKDVELSVGSAYKNVKVIADWACSCVIYYYAMDAEKQTEEAKSFAMAFNSIGIRSYIQDITGWQQTPSMLSLPGEPYWYKRVKLFLAQNKVPDGYFSIFQETIGLVADIETAGYILPDNAIPDISIGKCWANHLRNTGIKPENISVLYKHQYPGWAYPIEAKAYLEDYLPPFRRWFRESYKTEKMPKYFKGKDQSALPAISKLLGLPAAIKI